jgi:hypothetical protein
MPLVIALAGVTVAYATAWSRERLARRRPPRAEPVESALAHH